MIDQILIDEIMDFQVKTFPTSNPISKLHHLAKEIPELIDELENGYQTDVKSTEMEYADCFLLLLGSAAIYGLSADDIQRIVREKLEINRNRKWGTPDENGVVLHIKE